MAMQQLMLGYGAKQKTYVDDVFSTYVYRGNDTSGRAINNGIDLSGEGGLVWVKARNDTTDYQLIDTVRGANKFIKSNADDAEGTVGNRVTGFNSNGFTLGASSLVNGSSAYNYASWTLRKTEGFFDIVTWTGNGTNGRQISHSLSSIPGCIMVKCTSETQSWSVYHRGLNSGITPEQYHLVLNNNLDEDTTSDWNDTAATSTHFTVGDGNRINANNKTYVAYLFAGGESGAATARSVGFNGVNSWLTIADHADFDVGTNWTAECWFRCNAIGSNGWDVIMGQWTGAWVLEYVGTDLRFYYASSYKSLGAVPIGQWHHVAISKEGSTTRIFLNGTQVVADFDMGTTSSSNNFNIGGNLGGGAGGPFTGEISNVRIVQGTAVYTSSFRPSTEPLTNITNTVLLCCNNSSTTGSTVTPGTITSNGGNAAARAFSPFDDPSGFKFGENGDQNLVKCGSYVGNSTANNEVYIGWEPQWWLVKNVSDNQNWQLLDSTRGWVSEGNDQYLVPNSNVGGSPFNFGNPTPTGFNLSNASSNWQNESGKSYVYIALRRPDGYVGKPADAGTDVFAMDTGNGSSTIPAFDSGFPVDFAFHRLTASTDDWFAGGRLMQGKKLTTNDNSAEASNSAFVFDSNVGWGINHPSTKQGWGWKRHAGFDVVTYKGDGVAGRQIPHSLNKTVEMIWVKNRSNSRSWAVYHKDLGGSDPAYAFWLQLQDDSAQQPASYASGDTGQFYRAPTATHFSVNGPHNKVNADGDDYIAMLFSSTDVSAVGSYTGDGTNNGSHEISCGFTPRFIIIKCVTSGVSFSHWRVWDSLNGLDGSGNEDYLKLNDSGAKVEAYDYIDTTSTGFKFNTNFGPVNGSGNKMIYYAHA